MATQPCPLSSTFSLKPHRLRSDGNEWILHIPQSSGNIGTSPSDWLESYPGDSLWRSYPFAEMKSVYSIAPADWASTDQELKLLVSIVK